VGQHVISVNRFAMPMSKRVNHFRVKLRHTRIYGVQTCAVRHIRTRSLQCSLRKDLRFSDLFCQPKFTTAINSQDVQMRQCSTCTATRVHCEAAWRKSGACKLKFRCCLRTSFMPDSWNPLAVTPARRPSFPPAPFHETLLRDEISDSP
jgi:hypothetical protein